MNLSILSKDLPIPIDDGKCKHLFNQKMPDISLPNQDGNLLKLSRNDTFRMALYCYPMTGHPEKPLPKNWNNISGASGCTSQNCSFRDSYDAFLKLNTIPIGVTTQSVDEIKEMTLRLNIPNDVISDKDLKLINSLKLPTFEINKKTYIKRMTLIIEKSIIKHVFYPIFPPHLHVKEVIKWLKE